MATNYWGYRIDTQRIEYFKEELEKGNLRQGWGWLKEQDLRDFKVDQGAGRNMPMREKVKKGDILLVPRLPNWGFVAIVEATEDWDDMENGYKFEIDDAIGDYGHIFPAKRLRYFSRGNENVTGDIKATLKNPMRFWNINHCKENIDKLLQIDQIKLEAIQDPKDRFENSIKTVFDDVFNRDDFSEKLYDKMIEQFSNEDWELALVYGLKQLFPSYIIEKVGGRSEVKHGTDILIRIPGIIPDTTYCVAIQVKDYKDIVGQDVIWQINKADDYYENLIEKIVIITKADKDKNSELESKGKENDVKFIFAQNLKGLLSRIGQTFIGIK